MAMTNGHLVWADGKQVANTPSSDFWNDAEKESCKPYDIRDGNVDKLWRYLRDSTTYLSEFEAVLGFARELGVPVRGTGIDVAAGVCWTTGLLSKIGTVEKLYALDFSRHRLLTLAPLVLKAFEAHEEKIIRVLGSFYEVRLPDASVDFCLMCQAFHHADDPRRLLNELARILRPRGSILMIGENPIYPSQLLKKRMSNYLKMVAPQSYYLAKPVYRWWPRFRDLFPSSVESGDHYYQFCDYAKIFEECAFVLHSQRREGYTVFLGVRN